MARPRGANDQLVLEEVIDESYEPTDEEIQEYAQWLGMDVEGEKELLWIAREGLKAPLPQDWKPCQNSEGELYYFNFKSGESTWDHPCDKYYKDLYDREKRKESSLKSESPPQSSPRKAPPRSLPPPLKALDKLGPLPDMLSKPQRLQPLAPLSGVGTSTLAPLRTPLPTPPSLTAPASGVTSPDPPLGPPRPKSSPKSGKRMEPSGSPNATTSSSTTPSSFLDWQRDEEGRNDVLKDEFRQNTEKERKRWEDQQRRELEDWRRETETEYREKEKEMLKRLKEEYTSKETSLLDEHKKKLQQIEDDLKSQFAKKRTELERKNERELNELKEERKRHEEAMEQLKGEVESKLEELTKLEMDSKSSEEKLRTMKKELTDGMSEERKETEKKLLEDHAADMENLRANLEKEFEKEKDTLKSDCEKRKHAKIDAVRIELEADYEKELEELRTRLGEENKQKLAAAMVEILTESEQSVVSEASEESQTENSETSSSAEEQQHEEEHKEKCEELKREYELELEEYRIQLERDVEQRKLKLEEDAEWTRKCLEEELQEKEKAEHQRMELEHNQRVKRIVRQYEEMHKPQLASVDMPEAEGTAKTAKPMLQEEIVEGTRGTQAASTPRADTPVQTELRIHSSTFAEPRTFKREQGVPGIPAPEHSFLSPAAEMEKLRQEVVSMVESAVVSACEKAMLLQVPRAVAQARDDVETIVKRQTKRAIEEQLPTMIDRALEAFRKDIGRMLEAELAATRQQTCVQDMRQESSDGELDGGACDDPVQYSEMGMKLGSDTVCLRKSAKKAKRVGPRKRTPANESSDEDSSDACGLSVKTAERFIRMHNRVMRKRRALLEAARSSWVTQWQSLSVETDSGVLHAKQAVLRDMWEALEGQARRLNSDVRALEHLRARLNVLGDYLDRPKHGSAKIPATAFQGTHLADFLRDVSGSRSIKVFNDALDRALRVAAERRIAAAL